MLTINVLAVPPESAMIAFAMRSPATATDVASPHCIANPSGDGSAASKQLIVGIPAAFAWSNWSWISAGDVPVIAT